jgi:uncharacterized Zn-binding protein involved in type VI secretion
MSTFAARVGDLTATGDPIMPLPGPPPTVLIAGQPAARATHPVSGPACQGVISKGSGTVQIMGLPAARVGDSVTGANPATGAAVTTAIAPPAAKSVIIGG